MFISFYELYLKEAQPCLDHGWDTVNVDGPIKGQVLKAVALLGR